MLSLLLHAAAALATAGLAETSWYFHDQAGQWIEWHHGDICPPGAPHKECVVVRRSKVSNRPPDLRPSEPMPYAEPPRCLYLTTLSALPPLIIAWVALTHLWRRWRQRVIAPHRWHAPSTWALGLIAALACWWVPAGLAVLFPASPGADGWPVVFGLFCNVLIALAPLTLWVTYRMLFPPPGRSRRGPLARMLLWPALLLSSLLAPLLVWGPPSVLMFLFPPLLLPNMVVSLLAVAAVAAVTNAVRRRAARTGGCRRSMPWWC